MYQLKKIYLLDEGNPSNLNEPLPPTEAAKKLMDHWYGLLYRPILEAAGGYRAAMEQSAALARTTPLYRLNPSDAKARAHFRSTEGNPS